MLSAVLYLSLTGTTTLRPVSKLSHLGDVVLGSGDAGEYDDDSSSFHEYDSDNSVYHIGTETKMYCTPLDSTFHIRFIRLGTR